MTLTWHIIEKDLRRIRLPLAAWLALLAAKLVFFAAIAGLIGPPNIEWLARMQDPPELFLRTMLEPLIAYFLTGLLVYEDPLVGSDSFWVTRPISGGRLLGAKVAGAVLMFVVAPVLVNLPWWLGCGFGMHEIAAAAVQLSVEYLIFVILALGCASATNSFPRFVLWTIAAIAGIASIHLAFLLMSGVGSGVSITAENDSGIPLTRIVIFLACLLTVALEVLFQQYLIRHFRRGFLVLLAATILGSALACISPGNLMARLDSTDGDEKAGSELIHLETGGTASFTGTMDVPTQILGTPDDTAASRQTYGEWTLKGARIWKTRGWDNEGQFISLQNTMARLLGLRAEKNRDGEDYFSHFPFPRTLARSVEHEALAFHEWMNIYLFKGQLLGKMTLGEDSMRNRFPGGSLMIDDVRRNGPELSLLVTSRSLAALPLPLRSPIFWPTFNTWALLNREDGSLFKGRKDEENLVPWGLQLNMVRMSCVRISYFGLPDAAWQNKATFAIFTFKGDRLVERTANIDPFLFSIDKTLPGLKEKAGAR
jgi:hypothetical protein